MVLRLRALLQAIVLDDDGAAVWNIDQIACGAGGPVAYVAAQYLGSSGPGLDVMTLACFAERRSLDAQEGKPVA